MNHAIPTTLILFSLSSQIFAQSYADATCTGNMCGLETGGRIIECVNDTAITFSAAFTIANPVANGTGDSFGWRGVAISPFDGTIYVSYQDTSSGSTVSHIGTIPNPNDIGRRAEITRLTADKGLTDDTFGAITFDCSNNLYGISEDRTPEIFQIDLTDGNYNDTYIDNATITGPGGTNNVCLNSNGIPTDCAEMLFYHWENEVFHRTSTSGSTGPAGKETQVFFTRDPNITTEDAPLDGTEITYNAECDPATISAATYIGNGIVLIYCDDGAAGDLLRIIDISDITAPAVWAITPAFEPFSITTGFRGVFNYDSAMDDICKPPSCSSAPTKNPTKNPTQTPTGTPSKNPTSTPSKNPTQTPTGTPSKNPTLTPTDTPSKNPTSTPSKNPTQTPTDTPSKNPTQTPTDIPTKNPTQNPTDTPSKNPTQNPTKNPTHTPTGTPSENPTQTQTDIPTKNPTQNPTKNPTHTPTGTPSKNPTQNPTAYPTVHPTDDPTSDPTQNPTSDPTQNPINVITSEPTNVPTTVPIYSMDESEENFEYAFSSYDNEYIFDNKFMSDSRTRNVKRGETSLANIWGIFIAFTVINVGIIWCYRRQSRNEKY